MVSENTLPPPLCQDDYDEVKFWTEKAYDEYQKRNDGDTDGLATKKARRGHPSITDDTDEKHPYLEDSTGKAVDRYRLNRISDKARKIFNSLKTANVAPSSWGRMGLDVYDYFKIEMVCAFEEFRFCEGSWKLERWASRAYASWMQGVRKRKDAGHLKTKRKRSTSEDSHRPIDDSGLLKIDSDHDTDTATFSVPPAPSPALFSAASVASDAVTPIQPPISDKVVNLSESQIQDPCVRSQIL